MASNKKDATPEPTTALAPVDAAPTAVGAVYDYGEDAGAGMENLSAQDLQIPFLQLLQKGSPQVEEGNAKFLEGAKASMGMNTVTRDLYETRETGIRFLPVHTEHRYVEWRPREEGGGKAGEYAPTDPFVLEAKRNAKGFGKIELPNGNRLAETYNVYGLVLGEDGDYQPIVLAFSSTQIKHFRRWVTTARSITVRTPDGRRVTPPLWAHAYRLKTRLEQNAQGSWYGWDIKIDGRDASEARLAPDHPLYQAAKQFRDLITSGAAKATGEIEDEGGGKAGADDEF